MDVLNKALLTVKVFAVANKFIMFKTIRIIVLLTVSV